MTRLEIIELRTSGKNQKVLERYLKNWQVEVNTVRNAPLVKIYRHATLETDFSIHLQYDPQIAGNELPVMAKRLAATLKEFGLVNHTVWTEQSSKTNNKERQ